MSKTTVTVLREEWTITEDELSRQLVVEISNFKKPFKLGAMLNNKIYEDGVETIYFTSVENALKILMRNSLEHKFDLQGVEFETKEVFALYHPNFDEIFKEGISFKEAKEFVKKYPILEIVKEEIHSGLKIKTN